MAFDTDGDVAIDPVRSSGANALELHRAALERRLVAERRAIHRRALARKRRRARVRRNRCAVILLAAVLALVVWAVTPGGHSPAVAAKPPQLTAKFTPARTTAYVVPGTLGAIPWPSMGEGAVAVLGAGLMASSPAEKVVPIASLTKMMTAYIVLKDHPLIPGSEGPSFTMTQADVNAWIHADQTDESNVQVKLGEVLTEHQLLEALLIPSADNIADFLGAWDAGSDTKFVAKMNATAHALGLSATHYADASGVNPGSRSDSADQAQLAAMLMSSPVVRSIVSKPSLPFQVVGSIRNYNPALGVDGIIGVKSGFTSAAQGCLATAAYRTIDGHSVLVVSVALGQVGGLYGAATADEQMTTSAAALLVAAHPVASGATVGTVSIGGAAAIPVTVSGATPVIVGWPGLRVTTSISLTPSIASGVRPASTGGPLGTVVWSTASGVVATAPIVSAAGNTSAG